MLKEYSQILIDIQKKSRITIHKISDVKNLKNEIQGVTNKNISFNTLRRLFGYLPRTTPSQATLKILANYLGYTSYSNYLFNKKNYDDWYFKMKMLRLQLSNKVLTKEQVSLFNFGLDNNDNIVSVGSYISFLIEQNNINSLKVFYKNFNYEKLSNSNISKLSIIITFGFYKLSDKKILEIYKELIVFDSFRYTGPLFFIDYSNLNGYYMKALKMIKTLNKSKSDYLFVSIMEFYQKFYANEKFNNIVVAPLEDDKKIFPVLKGRYYAYKILASDQVDAIIQKKYLKN
ncbi:MAG: hypothetical protein P8H13_00475 [Polaribacter sp.]|nr:hypothetical protein [Polaribacter sp.]MDG1810397.1 hypothetical protein [Polaribacter sp.]MDG1994316.1 hypothetical protein [Polaribacter sp.]